MSEKYNISSLFNSSGNLTLNAIERYLRNELSKAERALVEEHVAVSEFDREALEGLKNHLSGNLSKDINDLNSDILYAARKMAKTGDSRISRRTYWYAAAGLAGLISLSLLMFFMFRNPVEKPQLAVTQLDKIVDSTTVAAGLKENSRIVEKINIPEIKSYPRVDENLESEPEESTSKTEINPEAEQQDSIQKPIEPDKTITTINDDVEADNDAISDEFSVSGVAINGDHNDNKENRTMMEEMVPINYEIQSKNAVVAYEAESPEEQSEDQIFMVVEQMPEYPGGEKALNRFLSDSLQYPRLAKENNISGTVYVSFVVEKDGSVKDIRVLRGIGGGCDEEAVRVVKSMPVWKPGKQRGIPVRVQYTIPVKFSLGN